MNRFVVDDPTATGQDVSTFRRGTIGTPHGAIRTPTFVPVAGGGSVQSLTPDDLLELGIQAIAFDGFELDCTPGIDRLVELGGLRRATGWSGPILMLSGSHRLFGQAFPGEANALEYAKRAGVTSDTPRGRSGKSGRPGIASDTGLRLPSPQDGAMIRLTPERAIATAATLGADLAVALDQPIVSSATDNQTEAAIFRTESWWNISDHAAESGPLWIKMLIGLADRDDRYDSPRPLALPFGLGRWFEGGPVGSGYWAAAPSGCARVSVGCGDPDAFDALVAAGADLIVSAAPTHLANMGVLYTSRGAVNARSGEFERDDRPIDEHCSCPTCERYSRAYLRHLFVADELLGYRLAALHNLRHAMDRLSAAPVPGPGAPAPAPRRDLTETQH